MTVPAIGKETLGLSPEENVEAKEFMLGDLMRKNEEQIQDLLELYGEKAETSKKFTRPGPIKERGGLERAGRTGLDILGVLTGLVPISPMFREQVKRGRQQRVFENEMAINELGMKHLEMMISAEAMETDNALRAGTLTNEWNRLLLSQGEHELEKSKQKWVEEQTEIDREKAERVWREEQRRIARGEAPGAASPLLDYIAQKLGYENLAAVPREEEQGVLEALGLLTEQEIAAGRRVTKPTFEDVGEQAESFRQMVDTHRTSNALMVSKMTDADIATLNTSDLTTMEQISGDARDIFIEFTEHPMTRPSVDDGFTLNEEGFLMYDAEAFQLWKDRQREIATTANIASLRLPYIKSSLNYVRACHERGHLPLRK
jgi:hypothetical protein